MDSLADELVADWENIYKRGLLTFWILLALYDGDKRMEEIKGFLGQATEGQISADDQSMYRALRRYDDTELVDFSLQKNTDGPSWKVYSLTPLGRTVLGRFAKRNIVDVVYKQNLRSLIERCAYE